uniref:Chloride channel protein n=1 Tax=Desulfobacca acetoxidans TaxID=60893 RepID=A0A7C3SK43_9BACT
MGAKRVRVKEKSPLLGQISHWFPPLRWMGLSILVGAVAGFGAILFDESLKLAFKYFITLHTGYVEPARGADPAAVLGFRSPYSLGLIVVPALGGLLSGLLVFLIAPEAEGHGTDAMIESFHYRGGYIRKRVPFVKILASAITIGSGGSAGKEGPIAQIGAGFGSILASALKLRPRERRILVLAGAAGGIGAIFHAPLGAALFAPEVLYRTEELEYEAILPCTVSSIVAYSIFSRVYGRQSLFHPGPVDFNLPAELLPFALFGVVCAAVGFLYIKLFYGSRDYFFKPLGISPIFKPALGGLMLGLIIFFYPQVMDGGYGWVQAAMEGKIFWHVMLVLALLKIVATSCTISSGGSGGVFGPSVFIGAMLGGAFGFLGQQLAPGWVTHPASFVVVGIGGFFAGVAKVPLSSIIMASEMCHSYSLLVPLMLVSAVNYLLLGRTSLYEKQVLSRVSSPAHVREFARSLLQMSRVYEAVQERPVTLIPADMPFGELVKKVTNAPDNYFPVVNHDGRMIGILSINDIREVLFEASLNHLIRAADIASPRVERVFLDDTLQTALDKMAALQMDELPVVRRQAPEQIVTMISKRDIISHYHSQLEESSLPEARGWPRAGGRGS